ncbi:MAG: hypothetical protein PWP16_974 [Eubacteriaceae bacterium]|jgi:hypothetical protein|nr:hypothetical protein [Eubacteriaceae bacterium]MDK2904331.1 hypothetical protein [Eubacteriaceae bacterium]MDK2935109.1 hypothetical protein [Eubacteriaceae bacterium]MDN5307611.1 hypothetical protein [Eubacteriaceae bacterium]
MDRGAIIQIQYKRLHNVYLLMVIRCYNGFKSKTLFKGSTDKSNEG